MAKLNKYLTTVTTASVALLLSAGIAYSATLDFNGATPCVSTDAFVTLSTVGAATCTGSTAPGGSGSLLIQASGPSSMRANFGGLVNFVSIDLGDYNADSDNIFLEVFNAANVSLGYVDFLRAGSSFVMDTLSIAVGGIAYAIFGTNANDLGAIFADNLTYREDTSTVPVPAAGILLLTGLGGLAGVASRRRRKTA